MGELSVSLLRLSYLVFLWLFVLAALMTLRRDVYGTTIRRRGNGRRPAATSRGRSRVPVPAEMAVGPVVALPQPGLPTPLGPAASSGLTPPHGQAAPGRANPTRLIVRSGPLRGTTLPLARSPIVIGRSSTANLVLDDEFVSGRHAQIVPRQGGWVLEDLGSTNGTFLGRERVTVPRELTVGQSVRIGNTTLEVAR
ncbi:MAG: FHA domain-containing protein [Bifidobacteriaceae bacterium]|nr:FHA domain-containing protein [Bifidobacteriaceae bacterium]